MNFPTKTPAIRFAVTCAAWLLMTVPVPAQLTFGPGLGGDPAGQPTALHLECVEDVVAHLNTHEYTAPVLRRLEVLLADGANAASVPGILRRGEAHDRTAAILIHTLAVVGTRHAQRSLTEIAGDAEQVHMNRVRAVVSTGSLERPVGTTVSSLWGMVADRGDSVSIDLANTSALALGVLGDSLRERDAGRAKEIRAGLQYGLHAAEDPMERSVMLKAVGNLADASLDADVAPYLADDAAPVRASAAQALGMMGAQGSRVLLSGRLETEPRGVVRGELVRALAALEPDDQALATVHLMVLGERHPEARAQMTAYLAQHVDRLPEARMTLAHLFENDGSKRVRMFAARALAP